MKRAGRGIFFSFLLAIVLSPLPAAAEESGISRVVLISVDGLRADAVSPRFTPYMDQLRKQGVEATEARCESPTYTVPNHVSMVTGLSPLSHGIISNANPAGKTVQGTIFQLLRKHGKTSGLYLSKNKLSILAHSSDVDRYVIEEGNSVGVVDRFVMDMENPKTRWDFCFIHLVDADFAGHEYGWMSQRYINAVYAADIQVGRILKALDAAGLRPHTLVILTADHGGAGSGHWEAVQGVFRVPWIATGPNLPPGSRFTGPVSTKDVAPTVFYALGFGMEPNMEGRPFGGFIDGEKPSYPAKSSDQAPIPAGNR